ncbi:MAG: HNH endonuclease [Candidatus Thorarchaeota archaeon]
MAVQYPKSWPLLRKFILKRDHYTCRQCGRYGNNVDHIVEKSRGGSDHPSNLRCLCLSCHAARHPHLQRRLDSGKYRRKKLQGYKH